VLNVDAANKQRVGDKSTMTPPKDGFGAHDDGNALCSKCNELHDRVLERRSTHVVGVPAEGRVSPSGAD
jgi:hypothetical protein